MGNHVILKWRQKENNKLLSIATLLTELATQFVAKQKQNVFILKVLIQLDSNEPVPGY